MNTSSHIRGNLLRGNQRLLFVPLLLATLTACQKNVTEPIVDDRFASTELVSTKALLGIESIIWQENADGSSLFNILCSKQTATSYGLAASIIQAFDGTK